MKKEGSHETRAVCEVMLSTVGLGGSGTPVRVGGREEEEGGRKKREGGGGRREGGVHVTIGH